MSITTQPGIVKPPPMPVRPDGIPEELKALQRWVCWRWTWNGKKYDKPPLTTTGRSASSTDPATWCTFAEALAAHQSGTMDGVGITLGKLSDTGPTLCGIDLDGVRDPATGQIAPWAEYVIRTANTYG